MGKGNRNGRGTTVSKDTAAVTGVVDSASGGVAALSPESVQPDNREVPEEGEATKVKKDRSNPPVYGIIGVEADNAGMDLLAIFPTRHQLAKNLPMVLRMSSRHYESLEYVKIKYIDITE